ncbi:TetR/AcrR family transcriptional regulator [Glacieibacterium megasporae]|uniref:TetR/AcrR family transcriptional regulator n=1 Tax=Glacieibacterium megasporae TaxID=2835787 RepID=UPI001C1E15B3|nr:TetR/AcrR family transcriptional regulator [Polymorphobacter megasporae]UAJ12576.1 TetR/AcrR family transcriptional regulator [Polymorphobacter megasporae]
MATTAPRTKPAIKKRGQGRPVSGENDVGRERLLVAAEELLREMPPSRVTISRIARAANADPALIRYYFGNRAALLVEVIDRVTGHPRLEARPKEKPVAELGAHIARTVQLVRRAPYLHRLINDELEEIGNKEARERVRGMNRDVVDYYRKLLSADGGVDLVATDPLFLHLAVLGASDFFSSAGSLIRELLPEGADLEQSTADFQAFLVKLFLDGMRKR